VEELWPHKGLLVLKFAGVDSISQAETLVGCELQVPAASVRNCDLAGITSATWSGCSVLDRGREIGRIEDVQFGAGEAPLLIRARRGGEVGGSPFRRGVSSRAWMCERKQVRMKLPEGLLEVNAPLTAEEKREQAQGARKGNKHKTEWTNAEGEVLCAEPCPPC
jgi:16S rRNA processing protein RimM